MNNVQFHKSLNVINLNDSIENIINSIYKSCTNSGIFILTGLNSELLQKRNNVFIELQRFMKLPMNEKLKHEHSSHLQGYVPLYSEGGYVPNEYDLRNKLNIEIKEEVRDCKELFKINGEYKYTNNDFDNTILQYNIEMKNLAYTLFEYFALSLKLDKDYFTKHMKKPMCAMNLNYYPPTNDSSVIGIGTHTDFDCFTMLTTNEVPGLEILDADGTFYAVEYVKDSLIINVADLLAKWTGGLFKSTVHRAMNQPKERLSVAFFVNVDYDTIITPIDNSSESIIAGEHLFARLKEMTDT